MKSSLIQKMNLHNLTYTTRRTCDQILKIHGGIVVAVMVRAGSLWSAFLSPGYYSLQSLPPEMPISPQGLKIVALHSSAGHDHSKTSVSW